MILAFGTLSTVQVIWLRSSVQMRQHIFDDNVRHGLVQVSHMLTQRTTAFLQLDLEALSVQSDEKSTGDQAVIRNSDPVSQALEQEDQRLLMRMDAVQLDSILAISFEQYGILTPACVAVFDRYGQPLRLKEVDENFREAFENAVYSIPIQNFSLRVHFPQLNRYLLHNLMGQFALTGLMLAIIAWGFFSAVIGAKRNKRVDGIRRDLMNNLTHELKTPISTIGLASEALSDADMVKNEDGFKHYVKLIREENKRLGMLVENVLQASIADSGHMQLFLQPLNTHDLIKDVLRNVAIQVKKRGGKIMLHLEANDPVVEADKIHLTNLVFNLIDNALKYATESPLLTISSHQATDGIELRFKDNGIGIAKDNLGKVFDRLYRVPTGNVHDVKGFGLGLSYVRTVVKRHRGHIEVESELGKGSTFILFLPKSASKESLETLQ